MAPSTFPLQPDDPLYNRASPTQLHGAYTRLPGEAAANVTTPWVDQNQTYTSHASHQVFLREYELDADGKPVATGKLLEGERGLATWADVKEQARDMLGIDLTDVDVGNVPLLRTDPYGDFVRGPVTGLPQIIVGVWRRRHPEHHGRSCPLRNAATADIPPSQQARSERCASRTRSWTTSPTTPSARLDLDNDPMTRGDNATPVQADSDTETGNSIGTDYQGRKTAYDNEMLDAHYITGDGRGNENIGLSAVHHVFHSEHNHTVEQVKDRRSQSGDVAFLNEWLLST